MYYSFAIAVDNTYHTFLPILLLLYLVYKFCEIFLSIYEL